MPVVKRGEKPDCAKLKAKFGYEKVILIGHYMSPWILAGITKKGGLELFNHSLASPSICLEPEQVEELLDGLKK